MQILSLNPPKSKLLALKMLLKRDFLKTSNVIGGNIPVTNKIRYSVLRFSYLSKTLIFKLAKLVSFMIIPGNFLLHFRPIAIEFSLLNKRSRGCHAGVASSTS